MNRLTVQYSAYQPDKRTAAGFALPPDHVTSATRAGLRFGGESPTMPPSDALEVSICSSVRGSHSISLTLQYDLLAKEQPVQPKPLKPLPAFKH